MAKCKYSDEIALQKRECSLPEGHAGPHRVKVTGHLVPRFQQIAAAEDRLFALDEDGQVWYRAERGWKPVPRTIDPAIPLPA